jgi:microcystin-dependent protein
MAAYPPPTQNSAIFNPAYYTPSLTEGITQEEADKRYLRFPTAQGSETFGQITVNGLATFNTAQNGTSVSIEASGEADEALEMINTGITQSGTSVNTMNTTIINPNNDILMSDTSELQYDNFMNTNTTLIQTISSVDPQNPDRYYWFSRNNGVDTPLMRLGNTFNFYQNLNLPNFTFNTPITIPTPTLVPTMGWVQEYVDELDNNYAKLDDNGTNQTFVSPITFQGSNVSIGTNAPLRINNINTAEYFSLFVDPNPNYDITIYSNQTTNSGLTVRNPNNSFTINPTTGNVATFLNPIATSSGNSITSASALIGNSLQIVSSSATVNGNQIATVNQIPSLTNYAELSTPTLQTFTGPITFENTTLSDNVLPSNDNTANVATTKWVNTAIQNALAGLAPQIVSGTILAFGGTTAPTGYLLCNGASVSQATYANLYAVIGGTYHTNATAGNFNLPNLCGKTPFGSTNTNLTGITVDGGYSGTVYSPSIYGGNTYLSTSQAPNHQHYNNVGSSYVANATNATNTSVGGGSTRLVTANSYTVPTYSGDIFYGYNQGQAELYPPFCCVNYIIKY